MITKRVLSLGAGVQSTALYLMFHRGQITPQLDCAVFADTQDEPGAEQRRLGLPDPEGSVYAHLDWLIALNGPSILVRTRGCLSGDLMRGENSTRQRFASIPAFTLRPDGKEGKTRRQCSKEYKTEIIGRTIRRDVCGALPGRAVPKSITVVQYIGISADETARATRVMRTHVPEQFRDDARKWEYGRLKDFFSGRRWRFEFPLVDHGITRAHCLDYLAPLVPHLTPRSACTFCPFHNDLEWDRLKREDPIGFAHAVKVDHALRIPGLIVNRNMDQQMFLHRSCKPLDLVVLDTTADLKKEQMLMFGPSRFAAECLGVCGV